MFSPLDNEHERPLIKRKRTVLAFGEGDDEKIFLRHLERSYCRRHLVSVQTGSAGGSGDPEYILNRAILARREEKRDVEFILLDTDIQWPDTTIARAQGEGIELIGNTPCLESFFFEILDPSTNCSTHGSGWCKREFENRYCQGNFDEGCCQRLFTKAILNEARIRIARLGRMMRSMETGGN